MHAAAAEAALAKEAELQGSRRPLVEARFEPSTQPGACWTVRRTSRVTVPASRIRSQMNFGRGSGRGRLREISSASSAWRSTSLMNAQLLPPAQSSYPTDPNAAAGITACYIRRVAATDEVVRRLPKPY